MTNTEVARHLRDIANKIELHGARTNTWSINESMEFFEEDVDTEAVSDIPLKYRLVIENDLVPVV